MSKTLEQLKDELETVCLRFNMLQEDIRIKIADGDSLYQRKIDLIDQIERLENDGL